MDAAAPLTFGSEENLWFWFAGNIDEPEILPTRSEPIGGQGDLRRRQQRALPDQPIHAHPDAPRIGLSEGAELTVHGSLSLTGGAAGGRRSASPRRRRRRHAGVAGNRDHGERRLVSFSDTSPAGTVVYAATFEGATDVAAENTSATVAVRKKTSVLSLSVSASKVDFGHGVRVTADLIGGFTNKTVTIWAVPYGDAKRRLAQGEVSSKGTLSAKTTPMRKTSYYATWRALRPPVPLQLPVRCWGQHGLPERAVHAELRPRWRARVLRGPVLP